MASLYKYNEISQDNNETNQIEKRKQIESESIFGNNKKLKNNKSMSLLSLSLIDSGTTTKTKKKQHQNQISLLKQKLNNSIKEKILVNNNLSDFKINNNKSIVIQNKSISDSIKLSNNNKKEEDKKTNLIGLVSNDYGLSNSSNSNSDEEIK
jgi:hypothetical protein